MKNARITLSAVLFTALLLPLQAQAEATTMTDSHAKRDS